jgi:hypothetical protein
MEEWIYINVILGKNIIIRFVELILVFRMICNLKGEKSRDKTGFMLTYSALVEFW